MFEVGLGWLQMMTVFYVSLLATILVGVGFMLRYGVEHQQIVSKQAITLINVTSGLVGGVLGSVGVMLILLILLPDVANWLVNGFLRSANVWQLSLQERLTSNISDSRTAASIGLILGGIRLGQIALGFVLGRASQWLFSRLMRKDYHRNAEIEALILERIKLHEHKLRREGRLV